MCIENGIVDEACKQCSTNVGATRSGKSATVKAVVEAVKFNTCSDKVPVIVTECKDLPKLWTK